MLHHNACKIVLFVIHNSTSKMPILRNYGADTVICVKLDLCLLCTNILVYLLKNVLKSWLCNNSAI